MLVFTYTTPLKTRTMAGHPRVVLPALGVEGYKDEYENRVKAFVEWHNDEFYPNELVMTELEFTDDTVKLAVQLAGELEANAPTDDTDPVYDVMTASAELLRQFVGKPKSDR